MQVLIEFPSSSSSIVHVYKFFNYFLHGDGQLESERVGWRGKIISIVAFCTSANDDDDVHDAGGGYTEKVGHFIAKKLSRSMMASENMR